MVILGEDSTCICMMKLRRSEKLISDRQSWAALMDFMMPGSAFRALASIISHAKAIG